MAGSSLLSPKLVKGAFIRLDVTGIGVTPQVIVFQYNSESITRKFKPYEKPQDKEGDKPDLNAKAAPYNPDEEFDLALELDATDALEEPESHPTAVLAGIADCIAAMEMLLYPVDDVGLLSSAISSLAGALGISGGTAPIPERRESPVVLLVWGPGRVVPVKITSFSVEEQAFNVALYPIRAKVTVGLKVLTDDFFKPIAEGAELSAAEKLAQSAYRYTLKQKKILAAANVANSIESALSMLPF